MMEKKSLLQLIRDKESDLNSMLDVALKEADHTLSGAQSEAVAAIEKAEADGASMAEAYLAKERERLDAEISALKDAHRKKTDDTLKGMKSRLPQAVDLVIKSVSGTG